MCLLKLSDRDTNCGHDECKNFYMPNKQVCMYNIGHPSQANNTQGAPLGNMPPQIQLSSLLSQKPTAIINPQQSLNVKRPATAAMDASIGEQETVFLNKKKVKPEEENKPEEMNQSTIKNNNPQPVFADINSLLSQQLLSQGSANQNAGVQPQLQFINGINGLTTANGQLIYTAKQDNPAQNFGFGNNAIYIPLVQPQTNLGINNNYTSVVAQNQQNVFNPLNGGQMFPQNMRIKNAPSNNNNLISINSLNMSTIDSDSRNNMGSNNNGSSPSSAPTGSNNSSGSQNSATEAFMKEFQSKMSGLLLSQNKMLLELKEKNDIIQDTLACLINEMSALKNTIKQNTNDKSGVLSTTTMMNINMNSNEAATTETLINYLYGQNTDFTHQLVLKTNIPLPLYRERNFKFTLLLTDKNGNLVENANRIPLTIGIYNSESVPKFIDTNTAGNKILKGFIEKDLINGSVTFDKIQIKEVTSHFRNGWIFFAVYPKVSNNANNNMLISSKENFVPTQKIRPFILEKVVVKAKKAKEKDADESENVFQDDDTDRQETISEVATQQ